MRGMSHHMWRFIPACAGNASTARCRLQPPTVHPRVCGERSMISLFVSGYSGSSPRVRGTRLHRFHNRWINRFIPACAGNAASFATTALAYSVHPRVCGERALTLAIFQMFHGSSPRVRGTHTQTALGKSAPRFIPACAGNAYQRRVQGDDRAVHPRVCGERRLPGPPRPASNGSSPRVRGTRMPGRQQKPIRRFIPACAGNAV